jgi:hypothetical protein
MMQPTAQLDIDAVVREVMRRLQAGAAADSPSRPPQIAALTASADEAGSLTMLQSVIAVATLQGRLDGIRQLIVGRRAVVTPAARDLLRQRGVQLVRQNASASVAGRRASIRVCLTADVHPAWAKSAHTAEARGASILLQGAELPAVVAALAAEFSQHPDQAAIVISGRPALAACALNRQPTVRAAVWSPGQSWEALQADVQPNVLVLDATGHGPYQLPLLAARWHPAPPLASTVAFLQELD